MFSSLIVVLSANFSFVVSRAVPLDSVSDSAVAIHTGGFATFYYQNGVVGVCGAYHTDNDLICAIDLDRYSDTLCGRQVQITNTNNGNSVTVTIADDCPTCNNKNSIDLSIAAFQQLDNLSKGIIPISWSFI